MTTTVRTLTVPDSLRVLLAERESERARIATEHAGDPAQLEYIIAWCDGIATDYTRALASFADDEGLASVNAADSIVRAYAYGFDAYSNGHRAPGMHEGIQTMVAGMAVGTGADLIFRAYTLGWEHATELECAAILAEAEPHKGHRSHFTGAWYCDTCESPYCDLA